MSWGVLPPAGNPIELLADRGELPVFPGYDAWWLESGTAALALALLVARHRQPQILDPQVVLPAYGCPDLIAAAVHAGVRPVLADIAADDPGYCLEALEAVLCDNTVAVVAVNFLGIRERLPQLRERLNARPSVMLIEDDAQWFPEPVDNAPLAGDAVCLSFGRGKPVSLLGGGAMLLRNGFSDTSYIQSQVAPPVDGGGAFHWKIRAYNLLSRPFWFGALSRLPGLELGSTRLRTLQGIRALDSRRRAIVPENIRSYLAWPRTVAERIHTLLPWQMDVPARLGSRTGRLLRYPVLCRDSQQRDALWMRLRHFGLGASAMYLKPLAAIDGVAKHLAPVNEAMGACGFADRLLTLPVHAGVDATKLRQIEQVLLSELKTGS